jgi:hypothetical protein
MYRKSCTGLAHLLPILAHSRCLPVLLHLGLQPFRPPACCIWRNQLSRAFSSSAGILPLAPFSLFVPAGLVCPLSRLFHFLPHLAFRALFSVFSLFISFLHFFLHPTLMFGAHLFISSSLVALFSSSLLVTATPLALKRQAAKKSTGLVSIYSQDGGQTYFVNGYVLY